MDLFSDPVENKEENSQRRNTIFSDAIENKNDILLKQNNSFDLLEFSENEKVKQNDILY